MTLDPDQEGPLYQLNRFSMMLYNTGFDQQEMLYQKNRVSMMLYNSRSDQQDIIQDESDMYYVVEHNILIGRIIRENVIFANIHELDQLFGSRCYNRGTGSA